ncbi:MAG: class I SAM-dependent methyltransferase, partial [Oscillospiraceae bacterium]|nr:class I SAM-dependent methyltransferase [Oscillospiraceae bacterium]
MRKSEIKEYFDTRAADWDRTLIKNDQTIQTILELAGVHSGAHVLDVACGTGVLIPYYLERKVASVTAVDISAEMIRLAQSKFPHDAVRFICGDAEHLTFDRDFDCVVVYNAFPHFP